MIKNIYLRFEDDFDQRISEDFGPFTFVSVVGDYLSVGPGNIDFASLDDDGAWHLINQDPDEMAGPLMDAWKSLFIFSK